MSHGGSYMPGSKVPGPLCSTKSEPMDKGTLNGQRSQPPGPVGVLHHRYVLAWELSANRTLIEFNRDLRSGSASERALAKHMGFDHYSNLPTKSEVDSYFVGYRLPLLSPVLLLPNPGFQATPWESVFGVTPGYTGSLARTTAYPVVNSSNEVVGHVGFFRSDEIFIPKMLSGINLDDVVASGMPAFMRKKNPNPDFWVEAAAFSIYQLYTSSGGEVIASFGGHDREGNAHISTKDFIFTVVSIFDGAFLVRGLVSAASQRVASFMSKRFAAWAEKRALAASGRKGLETGGKSVAENKGAITLDTLPPKKAAPGKDVDPFGATPVADTLLPPLTPGKIAEYKRWDAFHAEFRQELEKLRATKSVGYDAGGTGWVDEAAALME